MGSETPIHIPREDFRLACTMWSSCKSSKGSQAQSRSSTSPLQYSPLEFLSRTLECCPGTFFQCLGCSLGSIGARLASGPNLDTVKIAGIQIIYCQLAGHLLTTKGARPIA